MKKILIIIYFLSLYTSSYCQWISDGNNITIDKNVGIGTNTPQQKLDVNGNISAQNILLKDGSRITPFINDNFTYQNKSVGNYAIQWADDKWQSGAYSLYLSGNGGIKLFTKGIPRIAIQREGNVGIGTDTPQQKLDVNGNISTQNILLKDGSRITPFINDNFTYQNKSVGNYAIQWADDNWQPGAYSLYLSGNGGFKLFTKGIPRIAIQREGNVGIGTDTPQQKLDINGNISAQNILLKDGSRITPFINDNFTYQNKSVGNYAIQWADDNWHTGAQTLYISGYAGIKLFTNGSPRLTITKEGNTHLTKNLDVEGIIRTTEVKIESLPWADFVFNKDYKLQSLDDVENHIKEYRHLPNIPSEKEIKENGIGIGEMQTKLLQKIEELTLYIIEQNKKIQKIENELKESKQIKLN